jgi:hypothetical protein
MRIIWPALLLFMTCTGCASIIDGTSQTLTFNTNPPEADCTLNRNGVAIGNVKTPSGIVVKKTKDVINLTCKKDGYQDATTILPSEVEGATFGNIVLGGFIGWGIDSASGADNHYPEITTLSLVPVEAAAKPTSAIVEPSKTAESRLHELQRLHDDKMITDEEYEAQRKAILNQL